MSLYWSATSTAVRAFLALHVDRPVVERLLVAVQVPDEGLEAALEVERPLAIDPLVDERDPDALRQIRRLAQALADGLERELGRLEHVGVGAEAGASCPRRSPCGPIFLTAGLGLAALVLLRPDVAVTSGFDAHPRGQGVDHADADAVEAAGDLVAAAAELAAGVEHGMDDFQRVLAGGVLADRDAAAVVDDGDDTVGLDRDLDGRRLARHRFVDRVVDDLPDEVVQAADIGRADVHARALAHSLQAFEDLDAGSAVFRAARSRALGAPSRPGRGARGGFLGHAFPPVNRSYRRPSSSSL